MVDIVSAPSRTTIVYTLDWDHRVKSAWSGLPGTSFIHRFREDILHRVSCCAQDENPISDRTTKAGKEGKRVKC